MVLLAAACSAAPGAPLTTTDIATPAASALPEPEAAPAAPVVVDPALEVAAAAAIDLWQRAAGEENLPLGGLQISLGHIPECAARKNAAGCYDPNTHEIDVSVKVQDEVRPSTIAHEIGHSLGLPDMPGTGCVMDPDRAHTVRLNPCISADVVRMAGYDGPGACLAQ